MSFSLLCAISHIVCRGVSGNGKFKEGHAFIGYQKDTPAAVVFQASRQLKRLRKAPYWRLESLQENTILGDIPLAELIAEKQGSDLWKLAVSMNLYTSVTTCTN